MTENIKNLTLELSNMKLGQFIHFNSATVQFCNSSVIDWEYGMENKGEQRKYPFDPKDWNPYKLDCNQWAAASLKMGAKFAALTAKHAEGFCLWDTKTTPHNIANASCKIDVVAEYLKAYRSAGIKAGLYFSMLDLTHNICRNNCTKEGIEFTKAQLKELLTNYGEIPFLIVDCWGSRWGGPVFEDMPYEDMNEFIKSIQPNCVLINHSCEVNLDHTEMIFFENNAGQKPNRKFSGIGMAGNIITKQWFNKARDKSRRLRSIKRTVANIKRLNNKGISFLMNMSPNKYGIVEDNLIEAYTKIAQKLDYK